MRVGLGHFELRSLAAVALLLGRPGLRLFRV